MELCLPKLTLPVCLMSRSQNAGKLGIPALRWVGEGRDGDGHPNQGAADSKRALQQPKKESEVSLAHSHGVSETVTYHAGRVLFNVHLEAPQPQLLSLLLATVVCAWVLFSVATILRW